MAKLCFMLEGPVRSRRGSGKGGECFFVSVGIACLLLLVELLCLLAVAMAHGALFACSHVNDSSCSGHEECRFAKGGVWTVDAGAPAIDVLHRVSVRFSCRA